MSRARAGTRKIGNLSPLSGTVRGHCLHSLGKRQGQIGSKNVICSSGSVSALVINLVDARNAQRQSCANLSTFISTVLSSWHRGRVPYDRYRSEGVRNRRTGIIFIDLTTQDILVVREWQGCRAARHDHQQR